MYMHMYICSQRWRGVAFSMWLFLTWLTCQLLPDLGVQAMWLHMSCSGCDTFDVRIIDINIAGTIEN